MSYKIVRNANGDVIAWGENTEHFEPFIKEGDVLTIEENIPPPSDSQLAAIAKRQADKIESDLAKADAVSQYIDTHTLAEITAYVRAEVNAAGVTNLATAITALTKLENLVIKLAALHKIKD